MFRPNHIPVITLGVVLLALVIIVPSFGWRIRGFLSPAQAVPASQDLAVQNESLKSALAQTAIMDAQLPHAPAGTVRAMVYSRYPLDFKNEMLINAGQSQGVALGKAVMIESPSSSAYVFVGRVVKVLADTAVVQTVFDPAFKMPVRVGTKGYDGLFVGGTYPKVVSIAKGATVNVGDVVYSADASVPYGLALAEVSGATVSSDNLFQEAQLVFAYDVNAAQTVVVAK